MSADLPPDLDMPDGIGYRPGLYKISLFGEMTPVEKISVHIMFF
jgi:hypothetical protein